jgi:hypothetical protein
MVIEKRTGMSVLPYYSCGAGEGALVGEEVLLGEAGLRAEVGAAEFSDLPGLPVVEAVAAGHGLDNPGIHGKGFQAPGAEKQHAVGDFFTDAGQLDQPGLGLGVGRVLGGGEPTGIGGEETGDAGDVAGPEAQGAGA